MLWFADECVDAGLVAQLRQFGHDVTYAAEVMPGATDPDVARRANDEKRLLLTEDKDFGELVVRIKMEVPGLVLVRLPPNDPASKWARLDAVIGRFGEGLFGRYVVIQPTRFRSRPLLSALPK